MPSSACTLKEEGRFMTRLAKPGQAEARGRRNNVRNSPSRIAPLTWAATP